MGEKRKGADPKTVAQNLAILVNGETWVATHVAIVRRNERREQYVHLIVNDAEKEHTQEFFVERRGMIQAWLSLEVGLKKIDQLQIEINKEAWAASDISKFQDQQGREWIQITIVHMQSGVRQIIAIERDGMIAAYYALRLDVGTVLEMSVEAVVDFMDF
jgi:hypothetical protein